MKIEEWVNPMYLEKKNILKIKNSFKSNKPFPHFSIENFIKENKIKKIEDSIKKIEYYTEDTDLYHFNRSIDFKNFENKSLNELREFIFSEEFISFIEELTQIKISRKYGDLHSLKLEDTNYLLCHDDMVQGRVIAFILNLSKDWKEDFGGRLQLLNCNENYEPLEVETEILPSFNQFNLFEVSPKSFHQIEEVKTKSNSRVSISGWFYND